MLKRKKLKLSSPSLLIAGDHAGLALKSQLKERRKKLNWKDLGCFSPEPADYPDLAEKLCLALKGKMRGVLICGSGQGMAIKANRYPFIRAALCWNEDMARLSRAHNKANVLCLPGRFLSADQALKILDAFLETSFESHERHERRVKKLSAGEASPIKSP